MLKRALVVVFTLTTAGVWISPEAAAAPLTRGQSSWQRVESQHFEIHYLPALARELDRVVRSAERAYDHVSGRLNFVLIRKVPLVIFAPSGSMTREQVEAYATSDQVTPPQPHRSRIVLPLREGDPQIDPLIVHELTHLLVSEIILPERGGDGGVPRWVHEGIASYMVGVWSVDDDRLVRELVASGDVPALSQLTGGGEFANARLNDALGHLAFDYIEPLGPHQHPSLSEHTHRPACRQDLRRCFRSDASGIRRGVPPVRGTPIQADRSLTFRRAFTLLVWSIDASEPGGNLVPTRERSLLRAQGFHWVQP